MASVKRWKTNVAAHSIARIFAIFSDFEKTSPRIPMARYSIPRTIAKFIMYIYLVPNETIASSHGNLNIIKPKSIIRNNERTYISSVAPKMIQRIPAALKYHLPSNSSVGLYKLLPFAVSVAVEALIKHPYFLVSIIDITWVPMPIPTPTPEKMFLKRYLPRS